MIKHISISGNIFYIVQYISICIGNRTICQYNNEYLQLCTVYCLKIMHIMSEWQQMTTEVIGWTFRFLFKCNYSYSIKYFVTIHILTFVLGKAYTFIKVRYISVYIHLYMYMFHLSATLFVLPRPVSVVPVKTG